MFYRPFFASYAPAPYIRGAHETNKCRTFSSSFIDSMSQDSLTNGDHDDLTKTHPSKADRPSSTVMSSNSRMSSKMSTLKSSTNGKSRTARQRLVTLVVLGFRSLALDEHIKLVKQKKEEAEVLRLQRFQEQLRKKEQKW